MKKLFLIGAMAYALGMLTACNNNQTTSGSWNETTKEITYNDKIQNVFFGVPFGASRQEVVNRLTAQGFCEASNSTTTELSFYKFDLNGIKSFEFGDISWEVMYTSLTNNHLWNINFVKRYETKEQALTEYNSVLSKVSSKYIMTEESPARDPSIYKSYIGRTKNKQFVVLDIYYDLNAYFVSLAYLDKNYYEISDEL